MRPVDFHGVKPGFAGTDGGFAPAFHEAGDFLFAKDHAVVVGVTPGMADTRGTA